MNRKYTLKKMMLHFLGLFIFVSVNAQVTVTKTVATEGADYTSFMNAIKTEAPLLAANDILIINVAEGTLLEPGAMILSTIGKPLKITVQGAGAEKTIIQGPFSASNFPPTDWSAGKRICQFNDATIGGSEVIFKDMTFKYWGGNVNANGGNAALFNFNTALTSGNAKFIFKNIIFDSNISRCLVVTYRSCYTFEFDNCIFTNNILIPSTNPTPMNGLITKGGASATDGGGDLSVKNCTFVNNIFKPGGTSKATGGIISFTPFAGATTTSNIVIEKNDMVNNIYESASAVDGVQGLIGINALGTMSLTMNNNLMIGNKRPASLDADVYISNPAGLTLTAAGNIINEGVDGSAGNPRLTASGFDISPDYTYTSPKVNLEMDGVLPKLVKDAFGIDHVKKLGTIASIFGEESLHAYRGRNMDIQIDGQVSKAAVATLYDLQGRVIKVQQLKEGSQNTVNLMNLRSAVYILKVKDVKTSQTFKISMN